MKVFTVIALILIGSVNFQGKPPDEEYRGIEFFHGTWEEVLIQAEKENKIIFMDAYASWCGPCKLLKRNVFPNEAVGSFYNEHFINVKMDMEKGEGMSLSGKYSVSAYPTLLYLDTKGNVIKKAVGYHHADQLINLGKSALSVRI